MREDFVAAFAIGLVVIAGAVGAVMYMNRGSHVDLPGEIVGIRTLATGDNDALAIVNLHVTNPSDYGFMIRNVTVTLEKKSGEQFPRDIIARSDAQRLFEAMPEGGPYHAPLYTEAVIPPHTTADYTLAAQFSAPEKILQDRKRFLVEIDGVNGKSFEFPEN
jgi:hypothetical protein